MPHKSYTCVTIHKKEYEKLVALARAEGLSVRELIKKVVDEYVKALSLRIEAGLWIDTALLWIRTAKLRIEHLRKELTEPPEFIKKYIEGSKEAKEVHEYLKTRYLHLLEIMSKLDDIEKELMNLKALTK